MDPLQAFRLIDARLEKGTNRDRLLALRRRLAGELLGDPGLVDDTLAADFELVTHTQGTTAVVTRSAVLAAAARLGAGSALMWVELADLAIEDDVIAAQGLLRTLAGTSLTTMTIALFIRYDGAQMSAEVAYMNLQSQETAPADHGLPSPEQLRELLGYPKG